ncbi:MAG: hypothetical protein JXA11_13095 [Phycisphaerae bacterium]|nr:hypothetical protein [Phycisphaerae bacterium]
MTLLSLVSDLTSFGAAGLMGAMWLCERKLNRSREQQLTEAHQRIQRDEEKLACLTDVIDKNTAALVRFVEHQKEQTRILHELKEELRHARIS